MDDISQQINQFLSDPDSMRQLQSVMQSLGINSQGTENGQSGQGQSAGNPSPPAQSSSAMPDLSALAGMLGALGQTNAAPAAHPAPSLPAALPAAAGPDTLAMVTRLAPLLGQLNREDDSTRLLRALRPLLSEARRQKIDEAVKILQLMRLLPMLKDLGVGLPGLL